MKHATTLLLICLTALIIQSCKKNKDESNFKKLTDGITKTWVLHELKVVGDTDLVFAEYLDSCSLDDKYTFSISFNKLSVDGNTVKCTDNEPATSDSGSWAFNETESVLTFKLQYDTTDYVLLKLLPDTLTLFYVINYNTSLTYIYIPQ